MNSVQKYALAFLLALALHLLIGGLFVFNFTGEASEQPKVQEKIPEIIAASVLDETLVEEKARALKQAAESRQGQRDKLSKQLEQETLQLQQAKKQRLRAEKKARQQAAQRKKEALAEQQRLQELKQEIAREKQKQQDLKQQRLAAEKQRALEKARKVAAERAAAELQKQQAAAKQAARQQAEQQQKIAEAKRQRELAEQQRVAAAKKAEANRVRAEKARIASKATATAEALIKQKVKQNWNQPGSAVKGLSCTIRVGLIPSGDVMSVSVLKSSGDRLFDDSAERAVHKASPLPVPKDPKVFNKSFRSFTFVFAPNK